MITLRQVFACSLPKRHSELGYNEDFFLISPTGDSVAVSDGASDSYDSRTLARVVCEDWTSQDRPRLRIRRLLEQYNQHYAGKSMGWADLGAFERGSFATVLGVRLEGDLVHVTAIGDSLCVYHSLRGCDTFPMTTLEEVGPSPTLLSSRPELNRAIRRAHVGRTSWSALPGARLLLMTDALAGWFFSQEDRFGALGTLESVREPELFLQFIEQLRDSRELKNDDTTLVHLEIINVS